MELSHHISRNPLLNKTFHLSLKIVELYKYLINKKEFIMSKQLLKSGTSIGANSCEAVSAQTKKDFIAKLAIARKEGSETEYWLNLLVFSGFLEETNIKSALQLLHESMSIICSSIKTAKRKLEEK